MSEDAASINKIPEQAIRGDGVVVLYHTLPPTKYEKQTIFFEPDGRIYLRRFESIPLSTMTTIAYLNDRIYSMDAVYNNLSCYPDLKDVDEKSIEPGTLMAVKWKDLNKGVPIGSFPHSINTLIWNGKKRIACKIFKKDKQKGDKDEDAHKLQLTGVDYETIQESAEMLTNKLRQAAAFYEYITKNIDEYGTVVMGLVDSKHGIFIDEVGEFGNMIKRQLIFWPRDIPDKYQMLANGIIRRCTDLRYVDEIIPRAKKILDDGPPCHPGISTYSIKRAMAKYNYTLGFRVNRMKLCRYLTTRSYNACYFNELMEYVYIPISDEITDPNNIIRREAGRDNQFEIYESGRIKHSGTGSIPMENTYIMLMLDIIKGYDEFAIDTRSKQLY